MNAPTLRQVRAFFRQQPLARAGLGMIIAFLALYWFVTICSLLGRLGLPPASTHGVLRPGITFLPAPGVETTGTWVRQQFADQAYLATRQPGATLQLTFAGTDVALVVRRSPDAGRVSIRIDGQFPNGLPRDESGAYLSLKATTAVTTEVSLAAGLMPGIHHVTLENGDGEFAILAIRVRNWPPLDWAVALGIVGYSLVLFGAILHFWRTLAQMRGWLPTVPPREGQ